MMFHRTTAPRPDRAAARLEFAGSRRLDDHLDALDRAESREDELETLAAEIYDREIGSPMRAKEIDESVGEIFAGLDPDEQEEMRAAYEAGARAFGEWLHPRVAGYWTAWAEEKAREQIEKLDREAEDDYVADQVAA